MNNFDHDEKSIIPKLAVLGMWIMGIGIVLILPLPLLGVPMMLIGFLISISPQRP